MSQEHPAPATIVIPTGRGGCCCIIPLALIVAPGGFAALGALVVLWRRVRQRSCRAR